MQYVISFGGSILGLLMILMVITRSPIWFIPMLAVLVLVMFISMAADSVTNKKS